MGLPSRESTSTSIHAHRIFRCGDTWYFHALDGINVGPFRSEFEAQVEASILENLLKGVASHAAARNVVREFLLDARRLADSNEISDYVRKERCL